MTTIAYKDGVIAYDSRQTAAEIIVDDTIDKHYFVNNAHFFVTGDTSVLALDNLFNADYGGTFVSDTEALVVRNNKLYLRIFHKNKCYDYLLDRTRCYAIGSGGAFALAAMDMGVGAVKAVMQAMLRDPFTGGKVRVFNIDELQNDTEVTS